MRSQGLAFVAIALLAASRAVRAQSGPSVPKPAMAAPAFQPTHGSGSERFKASGEELSVPPLPTTTPAVRPDYYAPKPDYSNLAKSWQDTITSAVNSTGLSTSGTWTINDVVKAMTGSITKIADMAPNETLADAPAAVGAPGKPLLTVTQSNVTAHEFASNLLCKDGLKLTNCSGNNPCKGHRCLPGSVCLVDMCGGCNAKCISYAEIGLGFNKIMAAVGLSATGKDAPTPNLPVVDKLVASANRLAKSLGPKCGVNQIPDGPFHCRNCTAGTVAAPGDQGCTICGRGRYADAKTGTCKMCNPGYYAPSLTGNRYCLQCAANTFTAKSGSGSCTPCPLGFTTRGLKGQRACVVSPTASP